MSDQSPFGMSEVLRCGAAVRTMGQGTANLEETACAVVDYLRDHFVDKETGGPALALVRFYITRRMSELEPDLQDFARAAVIDAFAEHDPVCLTLLATAGEEQVWNNRRTSIGHKAIPLPSVEAVQRLPMVARLVNQLGLDPRHITEPDPARFQITDGRHDNLFFVSDAAGSPYVPAQDNFVIPYGIRSVVGLGGIVPDGAFFAVLLFSTVSISPSEVDALATISLSIELATIDHVGGATFAGQADRVSEPSAHADRDRMRIDARAVVMAQLLDLQSRAVEDELQRRDQHQALADEQANELTLLAAALASSEAQKNALVEGAPDCIIGMDSAGRIIQFNSAAETTFGYQRDEVMGKLLGDTLVPYAMRERHRLGLAHLLATGEGPIIGRRIEVNALHQDGTEFPVELVVARVEGSLPPLYHGHARDLTSARRATAELAAGRERLAHIARTLQTSLLPPRLPEIDGYELAAAFRAMGAGYEVGGDFYDVFELKFGKWALTLGDVCGKGIEAAALTALARYTLRAAAMRDANPVSVLRSLNEAIHHHDPDRFCTAVCVILDPSAGTVEVALGGHPHPLLLTPTGQVTLLGVPNPLLGPAPTWRGTSETFSLGPGDILFLFSDGITEARSGVDFFGDDRLARSLRSATGIPIAAVVERVESDVLDFAGEITDDFAILALQCLGIPGGHPTANSPRPAG